MTDTNEKQTVVLFGNSSPQMQRRAPDGSQYSELATHINQSETRVSMWSGFDDLEFVEHTLSTDNDRILAMIARGLKPEHRKYAVGLNEMEQIVAVHTGGRSPDWVSSSDPEFAKALSEHFSCPVGMPIALLTTAGRDALHHQHLDTAAQPAAFNYMGLTTDTATELSADTVLASEITTAGGGLIRAQCTFAHTAGTNTSTLTKTFTANGNDTLPAVIAKAGIFNAAAAGTMGYEKKLTSTATLTTSGDNLTITWTDTAG